MNECMANFNIDYTKAPVDYMVPALRRYVEHGIMPGSFMTAVLEGNLYTAAFKADADNFAALGQWCRFIYNNLPAGCYGSPSNVANWPAYVFACKQEVETNV